MAEIGGLAWAVIASYSNGLPTGAYGPYPTEEAAHAAIPLLQELPGMDADAQWHVKPIWQIPDIMKAAKRPQARRDG